MRQFFKYVLATLVGLMAFAFIGFLLLLGVIVSAASSGDEIEVAKVWSSSSISQFRSAKTRSRWAACWAAVVVPAVAWCR